MRRFFSLLICLTSLWIIAGEVQPSNLAKATTISTSAIGTAFTYQGQLQKDGKGVSGQCDFQFLLFDSLSAGTQIGSTYSALHIPVSNGMFVLTLDFGSNVFTGEARWLQMAVRCPTDSGSYTPVTPRQPLMPMPYAQFAQKSAEGINGFTVHGQLQVEGITTLGSSDSEGALILKAPDLWMKADASFGRGGGGRALVQDYKDSLAINFDNDFAGGVKIGGNTIITGNLIVEGDDLFLNGNDFEIHGDANRGNGGRAMTQWMGDSLYINYGHDFAGGVVIDSDARVIKDLTVEGNSLRLLGNDLYMQGDLDRGDGGRALVHTGTDQLAINYDGDFAGGVSITNLHTGKVVEQNLMTIEQQHALTLTQFEQGDILCWDKNSLELAHCTEQASPLVVAVADEQGKPIVMGAEPIKVISSVAPGDLLISSSKPGFAVAWTSLDGQNSPPVGIIVAKALEPCVGGQCTIKALIMLR